MDGAVATPGACPSRGRCSRWTCPPVADRTRWPTRQSTFAVVLRGRPGGGGGQAGRPGGAPRGRPDRRAPWSSGLLARYPDLAGGRRRCGTRGGRASSTGSTGAPRGCWRWPAPTPPTARWWPSWRPAPCRGATWRWWRATWPRTRGVVEAPIGRSTRTPTRMAVSAQGREARTTYRVLGAATTTRCPRPCSPSPSRPGGPTRSGCTWRPSATRWWATTATAARAGSGGRLLGPGGCSCTPPSWASTTRPRASGCPSPPRSPTTWRGLEGRRRPRPRGDGQAAR